MKYSNQNINQILLQMQKQELTPRQMKIILQIIKEKMCKVNLKLTESNRKKLIDLQEISKKISANHEIATSFSSLLS